MRVRLNNLDLLLMILSTLLYIIFIFSSSLNETPIRTVLGLIFVLFSPGYSLVSALFPRTNLDKLDRAILGCGLSIAIVPLLGFTLYYTPFGISLIPVLVVLSIFTILLSIVAWVRRMKLPTEERFIIPFKVLNYNLGQSKRDKALSIVLIASIIVCSITLVYAVVTPNTRERFTEFYLLGSNGTASDYPTALKTGDEGKLIIGIVNHEYENITYHLKVNFNGSLLHEENVFLIANEKWETPFNFIAESIGNNQKIEFILYKDQKIYRTLHIWVDVK